MDSETLVKNEKLFYTKVGEMSDEREILNFYERFYNYLKKEISTDEEAEKKFWDLISNLVKWIDSSGVRLKEIATKWNGKLASDCFEFSDWYRKNKNTYLQTEKLGLKFGAIFKKVMEQNDFATKAFCLSVLQSSGIINYYRLKQKTGSKVIEPILVEE